MIKILIAVALLCGAVFLGPRLADSQGFVHIATDNYIVETSLTTAIIVAFVAFLVLHVVVNIISRSARLPKITARWFRFHSAKRQQNLQSEAFLAYEEGAYTRALALLKKSGNPASLPVNCLFLAAKCAFKAGDLDNCRTYLDQAEQCSDGSEIACKILRAKLNLKIGNAAAALENLANIKKDSYTRAITTRLLYECYEQDGSYGKIYELLPNLRKLNLISEEECSTLTARCNEQRLAHAQKAEDVVAIINSLSKQERRDPVIMAPLLQALMTTFEDVETASKNALTILKSNSSEFFLDSIAKWDTSAPQVLAELKHQAEANTIGAQTNVPLLKAMANLELKEGKLAEAREHIKQALEVAKSKDLYLLAAELNERLAQYDEATKFFTLALTNRRLNLNQAPVPVQENEEQAPAKNAAESETVEAEVVNKEPAKA